MLILNIFAIRTKALSGLETLLLMAISNNEIKRVKSLQQKKFRDEYNLFAVEGEKQNSKNPFNNKSKVILQRTTVIFIQ